jgi:predicted transcriptional regulator of viral defense system
MQYIGRHGIVRPRDIEAIGLPREYLLRLHRQGRLNRPTRGIYTLADADVTEHHSYAQVTKRVPGATVCLLSALAFHQITTQSPASVWIALPKGARTPALASLRIVRLSAAKTVADCFKFRNKIGLDVAIEALKDCLRQEKASVNEVHRYAKVCRVSNVIRPYMEAL